MNVSSLRNSTGTGRKQSGHASSEPTPPSASTASASAASSSHPHLHSHSHSRSLSQSQSHLHSPSPSPSPSFNLPHHQRNLTSPSPAASSTTALDRPSSYRYYSPESHLPFRVSSPSNSSSVASHSRDYLAPRSPYRSSNQFQSPLIDLHALRNSNQLARLQDKLYRPTAGQHAFSEPVKPAGSNRRLRKSTSFLLGSSPAIMNDKNLRAIEKPLSSPKNRMSDESNVTVKPRKKNGVAEFVRNLVGSRKTAISSPENPVHLTHVGYDQATGEYTVSFL